MFLKDPFPTKLRALWVNLNPCILGSLSKLRSQRQWERHQTIDFMRRTMAVHVCYKSLYISLSSSAIQQREMTKFWVFWRTRTTAANFSCWFEFVRHEAGTKWPQFSMSHLAHCSCKLYPLQHRNEPISSSCAPAYVLCLQHASYIGIHGN